jgi:hypothetical protein
MSDFQEARAKRMEFAALDAERQVDDLRAGLIAREDVEASLLAAEDLLRRLAAGWARAAAAEVGGIDDLASIRAHLEVSANGLLVHFSTDLAAMGQTS